MWQLGHFGDVVELLAHRTGTTDDPADDRLVQHDPVLGWILAGEQLLAPRPRGGILAGRPAHRGDGARGEGPGPFGRKKIFSWGASGTGTAAKELAG